MVDCSSEHTWTRQDSHPLSDALLAVAVEPASSRRGNGGLVVGAVGASGAGRMDMVLLLDKHSRRAERSHLPGLLVSQTK